VNHRALLRRFEGRQVLYFASAVIITYMFWLVLSGHYTPLLMVIGAVSSLLVVLLASRMAVVDREGHPIDLVGRAIWFWPWLLWQIVKSGVDVSRIILSPSLPISPTLINVRASQKSAVGLVTYANSITLTPGTVSVEVEDDEITVHAITYAGAQDVAEGGMDRIVSRFEGGGDKR
jgi:multicomponent Na+:H+ antiporter subunit E